MEGLPVADKVAGLVRAIPFNQQVNGKPVVKYLPLACSFTDPTACTEKEVTDLVPNGKNRSIIYFEDMGWSRATTQLPNGDRLYTSKVRMIVWMNTKLIGEQCGTSEQVQQDIMDAVEPARYNSDPYQQVQHRIVAMPPVSNALFARYTYNEAERQFLTWPFSYFGLDIETKFILPAGCRVPVDPTPVPC